MRFAHPAFLWFALAVVPLLALFLWWSWRRRMRLIRLFVQERLLADLTVGFDQTRELQRVFMTGAAAVLLLIALARPQWGVVWEEAVQQGRDVLIAVDTSRSMLAVDEPPNSRLVKARLATLDLAQFAKTDRLGLIAFAGSAFLQCPLTLDEFAFGQNVAGLDTEIIPQGGTAVAEAIDTAIKAFEKSGENHRVLVMITDGEDHEGDIELAIRRAQKAKLRIFTVGVGTPQGEVIRVPDEQGQLAFLKDESGNVVRSRLNEPLLKKVAEGTGGFYLRLAGARPMEVLFKKGIDTLPKGDSASKLTRSYREQYYWFVLLAAVLLALEMFWMKNRAPRFGRPSSATKAAMVSSLFVVLGCVSPAGAATADALKDYNSGNYTKAYEKFSRMAEERKDDRQHFNAGTAAYKAGDFEKARDHFAASTLAEDLAIQQKSYFNMGNTLFRMGAKSEDPEDREAFWEDAIKEFGRSLELEKTDGDAQANLQFVQKQLELLKKQMDQQQSQDGKSRKSKKKDSKGKQNQNKQGSGQEGEDSEPSEQQGGEKDGKKKKDERQAGNKKDEDKKKDSKGAGEKKDKKAGGKDKDGKEAQDGGNSREPSQQELEQMAAQMKVMTEKQAMNVLDATKSEERTIVFQPSDKTAKPSTASKKDY